VYFYTPQTNIFYASVRDSACAVGSSGVNYNGTNSGRGNNGECWNLANIGAGGTGIVTSTEQGTGQGILRIGGFIYTIGGTDDGGPSGGAGNGQTGGGPSGGGGATP
jgi:hypothetical protein